MKKILILLTLVTFINCTSQEKGTIYKLEVAAFKEQVKNKEVQLVDVRTPEEYEKGAIENAMLINFYADDFKKNLSKLDKDKPVYLYCKSGGRSRKSCKILADLGFKTIYDLKGGYTAWEEKK